MTEAFVYVLSSLVWSAVGFGIGWFLGSTRREVQQIKEAVVPENVEFRPHHAPPVPSSRLLGIVVMLLAIASVGSTYVANQRISNVTECQADYNDRFADVASYRAALAAEDSQALQTMLITLYRKRDASDKERLRVFERWVKTVQQNSKDRKANPLPNVPKGDCR